MYVLGTTDIETDSLLDVGILGWVTRKLLQLNDNLPACKAIRNAQLSDWAYWNDIFDLICCLFYMFMFISRSPQAEEKT